jgi:hypothetical protein
MTPLTLGQGALSTLYPVPSVGWIYVTVYKQRMWLTWSHKFPVHWIAFITEPSYTSTYERLTLSSGIAHDSSILSSFPYFVSKVTNIITYSVMSNNYCTSDNIFIELCTNIMPSETYILISWHQHSHSPTYVRVAFRGTLRKSEFQFNSIQFFYLTRRKNYRSMLGNVQ